MRTANSELLTVSQVAEYTALSPWAIRRYIQSGKLTAFKTFGGHYRIPRSEVDKILVSADENEVHERLTKVIKSVQDEQKYQKDIEERVNRSFDEINKMLGTNMVSPYRRKKTP